MGEVGGGRGCGEWGGNLDWGGVGRGGGGVTHLKLDWEGELIPIF